MRIAQLKMNRLYDLNSFIECNMNDSYFVRALGTFWGFEIKSLWSVQILRETKLAQLDLLCFFFAPKLGYRITLKRGTARRLPIESTVGY